ncbi:MAG: hypothetical protein IIZ50_06750 [Bifidobacterium sp.]|uniref:CTP synthase n=1 Tax=Bifidobacterium merycicum TaxID=78345 RepID=A0A087BI09_9BIFI|nr:hypothetical protein BMERY_0068 [Bifidobacterium merycicum]MBQ1513956.1 hypothetical protein [Bifidobacterium sp.]SHE29354.1 Transcriptional regulator, AbiEi antitoxin, Type IV TA system [Bifidobacterium merycicum DSM 6492]
MKNHRQVDRLISEAKAGRRCIHSTVKSEVAALRRRATDNGELVRVIPGFYAPREYWHGLPPPERTLHLARAVGKEHPQWVFAGTVAAAAHGLEHQWVLHDDMITIADARRRGFRAGSGVRRLYVPDRCRRSVETVNGIRVTNVVQTVLDCARMLAFRHALPIADSALARGVKLDELLAGCTKLGGDMRKVMRVLKHADGASENGGESLCRAVMIEGGFMVPSLQVVFYDPESRRFYRVDFMWVLPDGSIIVGEFDGAEKYFNPQMTGRRSIQATVQQEREREAALRRAGVRGIVRFTYDEVADATPLWNKLAQAGIPRT